MAHFDELMQRALTVRNNVAPSSNTAILVGGVLVSIVSALQWLLENKQGTLTFDNEPTDGSTNPVTSDGIYDAIVEAIADIDLSACEKIVNKVTAIDSESTDVQYPTAKLLYDSLQIVDAYLNNLDARVTSLENDPPVTYIIRGTSSNTGGTETFRIRFIAKGASTPAPIQYITVDVDNSGYWEIKYVNKYVYSLREFAQQSGTLLTCDFSQADAFSQVVEAQSAFYACSALASVNLPNATFEKLQTINSAFFGCVALTSLSFPNASFAALESIGGRNVTGGFVQGCSNLQSITFKNGVTFDKVVTAAGMCKGCSKLTYINIGDATWAKLEVADGMFEGCSLLPSASLDFSNATFDELISVGSATTNSYWFRDCVALTSLSFPATTFPKLQSMQSAFVNCSNLQSLTFKNGTTFGELTNIRFAFAECPALTTINLNSATFAKVTNCGAMFRNSAIVTLDLSSATFAALQITNYDGATTHGMFCQMQQLQTLLMGNALFDKVTNTKAIFAQCNALSTIDVPQNSTAILPTSTAANAPMDLHYSPLNYASMLKVANWLSNLTGYSAHTITFNTTAWNALTAAEQSNIDTILQAKNWTRVLSN